MKVTIDIPFNRHDYFDGEGNPVPEEEMSDVDLLLLGVQDDEESFREFANEVTLLVIDALRQNN